MRIHIVLVVIFLVKNLNDLLVVMVLLDMSFVLMLIICLDFSCLALLSLQTMVFLGTTICIMKDVFRLNVLAWQRPSLSIFFT